MRCKVKPGKVITGMILLERLYGFMSINPPLYGLVLRVAMQHTLPESVCADDCFDLLKWIAQCATGVWPPPAPPTEVRPEARRRLRPCQGGLPTHPLTLGSLLAPRIKQPLHAVITHFL